MIHKHSYLHYCCFVSQLITSLTESTTCPLEKTFLGLSALWMARRKSLLIVRLCCPSLLFIDLKLCRPSFQMLDMIPFCSLPLANHIFQYFITIVPTKLNTYKVSADTHQYSVTEQVDILLKTRHLCTLLWSPKNMNSSHSSCSAGSGNKPCCRQSWSLRDLYEIWYQFTNGESHGAAHASLAVSRQALWHHRRDFLHHR